MVTRYLSTHRDTLFGIMGSVLILLASILPMFTVTGSEVHTRSEWEIAATFMLDFFKQPFAQIIIILFALTLLCALFALGVSVAALVWTHEPRLLSWRRLVAIVGLLIQLVFDAIVFLLLSFSLSVSIHVGFVLTLIGFFILLRSTKAYGSLDKMQG